MIRSPDFAPAPKVKPNPVKIAENWLGKRLIEKPGSGFWLDSVPASLDTIMRAANFAAKAAGAEQCGYNERWRV